MRVTGNAALVLKGVDLFIAGRAEEALAYASPDVVTRRVAPLPDPQTRRGRDGMLRVFTDWTKEFGEFEMSYGECVELGDRVLLEVFQRAKGRASGAEVLGVFWLLYLVEDDLVTRLDIFDSRERAVAEAGAS